MLIIPRSSDRLNDRYGHLAVLYVLGAIGLFFSAWLTVPMLQLAAFNHLHIFIDPNPEPANSFAERQRLFDLPRSAWSDYDTSIMSAGGGIFSRSAMPKKSASPTDTPPVDKIRSTAPNATQPSPWRSKYRLM